MERNYGRAGVVGLMTFAVLAGGASAYEGCTKDYNGRGDDFIIEGPIVGVNNDSITIIPEEIIEDNGRADEWFDEATKTQVHDNFENDQCMQDTVGEDVIDIEGEDIGLSDLEEGQWVRIVGNIRSSKDICRRKSETWSERPVFETVQEIDR